MYLADRRLHIVAAPGSGKTTLGLEIFRRLDNPTLVLSPTRVIRNQWISRLKDYCPADEVFPPAWTSRSLDAPGFFTSITYQALHTKYRDAIADIETDDVAAAEEETEIRTKAIDDEEASSLIAMLKGAGIRTLILDEAHHLRAEWWKALNKVVELIDGIVVVSLTATPPYDSKTSEWKRYELLCGVIDEEISVPELVKAGTLCPHQDFVWTVVPTEYERTYLDEYEKNVREILNQLRSDELLQLAIQNHDWISKSGGAIDEVLDDPETAIALLVYLKGKKLGCSPQLLKILDLEEQDIPAISDYWWQKIVSAYLYTSGGWPDDARLEEHRKQLARTLRDRKLLRRRELQLSDARLVKSHMTQSSSKIQACVDIYRKERQFRKEDLRQVILTDYIRDEGVNAAADNQENHLGAWPIFRALANQLPAAEAERCALLTGRLIVLHDSVVAEIGEEITYRPLQHMDGFVVVDSTTRNPVNIITELLESGAINVLVGTRALLGEGWDAPCINSLVLASSVGSYMLTNQMRGRAIRVDKKRPDKVASIWHIVAIVLDRKRGDPVNRGELFLPGLADFRELDSRFSTFVGLHEREPMIENNLSRLDLPYVHTKLDHVSGAEHLAFRKEFFLSGSSLENTNSTMVERLYGLRNLHERWSVALETAVTGQVVPTVSPERPPTARLFHFGRTAFFFLLTAIGAFVVAAAIANAIVPYAGIAAGVGLLWALPKLFIAGRLYLRHLPVDGTVHQIGLAVRDTLCATGIFENSASRLDVQSHSLDGEVFVNLAGGSFHEKSIFADCMEEILGPIDNPRYLLIRHGTVFGMKRKDYHAVPLRIGVKREYAAMLHKAWLKHVGKAQLVYTRTKESRKTLLYARARAFSAATKIAVKRMDRWV